MPRFATALLLMLVMPLVLGPAPVRGQDATPAVTAATGTLLDVAIDRDQLPGEEGFILLGRNTFQPGSRQTSGSPDEVGTIAIVVESGELTYQIDGSDGRILRGAHSASPVEEAAPAGTPFTLTAGDALVYPAQKRIEMNEGDEPAVFLFVVVLEPIGPPEPDPSAVGEFTSEWLVQSSGRWPELPPGPVSLTLRQRNLGAGEMLPAAAGGLQIVAPTVGDPNVLIVASNGVLNLGEQAADLLVVELAPTGATTATPVAAPMPGTPTTGVPSEVLLAVTIPAAVLPTGPAYADFYHSIWAPGDEAEFPEWHPAVSVQAEAVLEGEYGARSEGEIIAWRNGQLEDVPLGEEVVLGAGEGALYLDNAANQWVRNAGTTATEIVTFIITSSDDVEGPNLGIDWEQSGLSGNDVALTIERQTLAPGEALPAITPTMAEPTLRIVVEGELEWVLVRPNEQRATPALRFGEGFIVPFVAPAGGGRIELRNAGAEPLVLVTLTLAEASDGARTPVA